MIEEAKALGKPDKGKGINEYGWMTFEFWLASQKIIEKYLLTFVKPGMAERSVRRRKFLEDSDTKNYELEVQTAANWKRMSRMRVSEMFYSNSNINLTFECEKGST
jgi:hypothetical protein